MRITFWLCSIQIEKKLHYSAIIVFLVNLGMEWKNEKLFYLPWSFRTGAGSGNYLIALSYGLIEFFRAIIILVLFGWTWQICWNWDWKSRTNFSLLIDFLSVGWRLVKVLFPFSLWMGIAKELIGNRWLQFCDFAVNPWPIWMKYDEVYGYVGENLQFIHLAQ